MNADSTVAALFELAIRSENTAREFYEGLAALFAHEPEAAAFWKHYADQEAGHTRWLERLRDQSAREVLGQPADPHMLASARNLLRVSPAELLQRVANLEDAYQIAVGLENSETNTLFDFLITHYATDPKTPGFLREQLSGHVAYLSTGFPMRLRNAATRSQVAAHKPLW